MGIAAAFLAELHAAAPQPPLLAAAQRVLAFAERLPKGATGCAHVCKVRWVGRWSASIALRTAPASHVGLTCKVAWGAALVYRQGGGYLRLAQRVCREWFLEHQREDGLYCAAEGTEVAHAGTWCSVVYDDQVQTPPNLPAKPVVSLSRPRM